MGKVVICLLLLVATVLGLIACELIQMSILPFMYITWAVVFSFFSFLGFFYLMFVDICSLPEGSKERRKWGWALLLATWITAIIYFFSTVIPRELQKKYGECPEDTALMSVLKIALGFVLSFVIFFELVYGTDSRVASGNYVSVENGATTRIFFGTNWLAAFFLFCWMMSRHVTAFGNVVINNKEVWSWVLVLTSIFGAPFYFYSVYLPMKISGLRKLV